MDKIHLSGKTTQLSKEQAHVHSACIGPLITLNFFSIPGMDCSSNITNTGNMPYECKDPFGGEGGVWLHGKSQEYLL